MRKIIFWCITVGIAGCMAGFGINEVYLRTIYIARKFGYSTQYQHRCVNTGAIKKIFTNYTGKEWDLLYQKINNQKYCCASLRKYVFIEWLNYLVETKKYDWIQKILRRENWRNSAEKLYFQGYSCIKSKPENTYIYWQKLHNIYKYNEYVKKSKLDYFSLKIKYKKKISQEDYHSILPKLIYKQNYLTAKSLLSSAPQEIKMYYSILIDYEQDNFTNVVQTGMQFSETYPRSSHLRDVLWKTCYSLSHKMKKCRKALLYYEKLVASFPEAYFYIMQGDTYVCASNYKTAAKSYLQATQCEAKEHLLQIAYYAAANAFYKQGHKKKAMQLLEKASTFDGNHNKQIQNRKKQWLEKR